MMFDAGAFARWGRVGKTALFLAIAKIESK